LLDPTKRNKVNVDGKFLNTLIQNIWNCLTILFDCWHDQVVAGQKNISS
jgi:hypothetical protein